MSTPRYISTRGGGAPVDFAEALLNGIAPDGGLYAPQAWPTLSDAELAGLAGRPYAEVAFDVLSRFVGDALPGAVLRAAVDRYAAFDDPAVVPLVELEPGLFLLELFHGPTAAFKDLAMQLMAVLVEAALEARGERMLLLTATSGDTGAAAVRAFSGSERIRLVVLHPLDRVSPVQRRQMTMMAGVNVLNLAVEGDFDDCQGLVKGLLADATLAARTRVSSVNSINWGRLAGQVPYYLTAAAAAGGGKPVDFVVPTGNFGDAFAGWAARRMGGPVGRLVAAVNANDALAVALNQGRYARRQAVATASVSMDVQAPSNFERLVFEASGRDADGTRELFARFAREGAVTIEPGLLGALRAEVSAVSVDEAGTAAEIVRAYEAYGRVICPHTAVALAAARRDRTEAPTVVLATAHPGKFHQSIADVLNLDPQLPAIARPPQGEERLTVISAEPGGALATVRAFQDAG
jgi:threonine synthase